MFACFSSPFASALSPTYIAVIATLDDSRYALEEQRAVGQFEFARATYEDKKQLREKNFTSDYELKKAAFDRQIAENDLAGAKLNLSYCTVRAPFAGKIVERGSVRDIFYNPGHPYTVALLRSLPTIDTKKEEELVSIPGTPPDGTER